MKMQEFEVKAELPPHTTWYRCERRLHAADILIKSANMVFRQTAGRLGFLLA